MLLEIWYYAIASVFLQVGIRFVQAGNIGIGKLIRPSVGYLLKIVIGLKFIWKV